MAMPLKTSVKHSEFLSPLVKKTPIFIFKPPILVCLRHFLSREAASLSKIEGF